MNNSNIQQFSTLSNGSTARYADSSFSPDICPKEKCYPSVELNNHADSEEETEVIFFGEHLKKTYNVYKYFIRKYLLKK